MPVNIDCHYLSLIIDSFTHPRTANTTFTASAIIFIATIITTTTTSTATNATQIYQRIQPPLKT